MRFLVIIVVTGLLVLMSQTARADYQAGLDAYNIGDFTTALQEWKAVIESPRGKVSKTTIAETNYRIGMLYWNGEGVPRSQNEASKWLHQAAKLGLSDAQAKVGYLYMAGIMVPQNYKKAFKWFNKAAKQGNVDGQFNLGILYQNGWGTKADKAKAEHYLAAAAAQRAKAAEIAQTDLSPILSNLQSGGGYQLIQGSALLPSAWILEQNPDYYTIQVVAVYSKSSLEKLVKGFDDLAPFAVYTLESNNKPLYILVQGVYTDAESARKARDEFPPAIEKPDNVWIRKFEKIQELINPPVQAIAE